MLHYGDGVLGVMRGVGFVPDIAFSLMAKKLHFSLIYPEYLLPYFFLFKQWLFSGHSSLKPNSVECTA
jgi:hypothetical protein